MNLQGFGARIRQAILDRASQMGQRYTNRQLARDLGVSDSAITEWISERSEPSIATFRAIAKATGKPVEWLMALDIEPNAVAPVVPHGEPLPRKKRAAAKKAASDRSGRRRRASGD